MGKKEKKAQNQCITVIVYYVYRFLKFGAMKFDIVAINQTAVCEFLSISLGRG